MQVRFRIQRFNPEQDSKPHVESYVVELEPTDRVLDGLHAIRGALDGTLAFRRSCAHGICGSDGMCINGKNRLACKILVKDLKQPIVVEPLPGFPVLKDLVVNMEGFFTQYRAVQPYLQPGAPPPQKEHLQSPAQRAIFEDTTKCILCGICTGSCPSFWANHEYVGPAAIVQAHRFIFDSRDTAAAERLNALNQRTGIWRCRTIFNCVDACPRGIDITKAIADVKRASVSASIKR